MRKKTKRQKRDKNKATRSIETLAREFAKVMGSVPKREHINETFIDEDGYYGCIPAGIQYGYQYCQNCFYVAYNGCQKLHSPTQWRLKDGRLEPYDLQVRS